MAESNPNVVSASTTGPKLPDGVVAIDALESSAPVDGCRVFTHYNGPTGRTQRHGCGNVCPRSRFDAASAASASEEEFIDRRIWHGRIVCAGKTTEVGPGAMMYCAGNVIHGITNTEKCR